jgi:hypothetical protein
VLRWRVWVLLGFSLVYAACASDTAHEPPGASVGGGGSAAGGAALAGATEAGVPGLDGGGEPGTGGTSNQHGGGAQGATNPGGSGSDEAGAPSTGGATGEAGSAVAPRAGTSGDSDAVGGRAGVGGTGGIGGAVSTGGVSASAGAGTAGSVASGGSSPVSITVDDFSDYQVVQRIPLGSSQQVSLHGSLTDADARTNRIEARVVDFATGTSEVVPWTSISTDPAGTFTGQLEVPEGGWYRIAVRAVDAANASLAERTGTHRWGVGVNILLIGQSNMVGNGNAQTFTQATSDLSALYGNDNHWKHLADPYDGGGSPSEVDYDSWIGASLVPSLANALAVSFAGIPVGFVTGARGSSPLHGTEDISWVKRSAANHADTTNLYGNSVANARAAGGVELVVMHQGETDATNETTQEEYEADLQTLLAHYREDLYDTVPLFICQIGRATTTLADKNRTDENLQRIRSAQHDADDGENVLLAAVAIDLPLDPSAADHYTKAGHDLLGPRIANAIGYYFGDSNFYRGPTLTAATYATSAHDVVEVHVQHHGGTDFSPSTGINGFQVLGDGSPVPISAVTRKNASTISIALGAPLSGVGKVRYLYGRLAVNSLSGAVHDDSDLELPLEPTAADLLVE